MDKLGKRSSLPKLICMGTDQVIVATVILAVIVVFTIISIEYMSPMFIKLAFDRVCRDYLLIAEANNGLSLLHKKQLEEKLLDLGLESVSIKAPAEGSVTRRSLMTVNISGRLEHSNFVALFKREKRSISLNFDRSFLTRLIVE